MDKNVFGNEMNWLEKHSVCLKPKEGKCSNSSFKNGMHRIGLIESYCPLDGGLKGSSASWVCVDCGEPIDSEPSYFVAPDPEREYPLRGN